MAGTIWRWLLSTSQTAEALLVPLGRIYSQNWLVKQVAPAQITPAQPFFLDLMGGPRLLGGVMVDDLDAQVQH